jgi:hypothetical protein
MRCWLTRQLTQAPQESQTPQVQVPPPSINWERRLFWLIIAFFVLVVATVAPITYFACALLKQWSTVGTEATKALQVVNRNCDGGKEACGTLADVNQTLHTIRGTFGQIEVAAKHENAQVTKLDSQEKTLFDDAHGVMSDARETIKGATGLTQVASGAIQTTQETIRGAQPALASLTTTLDAFGALAKSAQKRTDDSRVDALLTDLESTSAHVDGATGDVQTVFDRVTNPPKCKGRACVFIKALNVISAAHDVPEFGYWTDQLIQSLRHH